MFTGIVEKTASVASVVDGPGFKRLIVLLDLEGLKTGQSIAINGVCLTVAEFSPYEVVFEVVKETSPRVGTLGPASKPKLEGCG